MTLSLFARPTSSTPSPPTDPPPIPLPPPLPPTLPIDPAALPTTAEERARQAALTAFLLRVEQFRPGLHPPSSRMHPDAAPLPGGGDLLSLTGLWGYTAFISRKAADVVADVLRHHVYGPKRKSWGLQMTVLSAFMRGVGKYSGLGNLALIRALMALPTILPPSSEALITPITFRVRRRRLRGLLSTYDAVEDGSREITAEWVVSKLLWKRLNAEWKRTRSASSTPPSRNARGRAAPPQPTQGRVKGRVILYLHGGAYYVFNASTHRQITVPLSHYAGARVFAINYRLAPETRFPGPLHDAVAAYLRLTVDMAIPPSSILLAGDSAGGGLTLALAMYLRDNAYPLPAGIILMSPWVDLTMSSDSWDSNAAYDIVPVPEPTSHLNPVTNYLGAGPEGIGRWLTHPYASPLFGEYAGLPPMLVQCGEAEVLRDEGALLAHKAASAGVDVSHEVFEDAVHVFQMLPFLPQTGKAFESVRDFVRGPVARHVSKMREGKERTTSTTSTSSSSTSTNPTAAIGASGSAVPTAALPPSTDLTDAETSTLDEETVTPTQASRVVTGSGAEVAVGEEASKRELEAGDSGSSDSEELDLASPDLGAEREQEHTPMGTAGFGPPNAGAGVKSPSGGSQPIPIPASSSTSALTTPRPTRQHHRQRSYQPQSQSQSHSQPQPQPQPQSQTPRSPRSRTHLHAPSTSLSMSASYTLPVSPRSRALSHPDMQELVRSWESGPRVRTVTWSVVGGEGAAGVGVGLEGVQRAGEREGEREGEDVL